VRALVTLWVAATVVGCAGTPPKAEPTPSPTPTSFRMLTINELALPVTVLPAGTKVVTDGPFSLRDLAAYENGSSPVEIEALLVRNGYLSSYFREFDFPNEGKSSKGSLLVIVLFTNAAGAQTALTELADARRGWHEMSLGGTIGERSRGMIGDFSGSNTGPDPISVADVLFSEANALLIARTIDDIGTVNPQEAIQFAKAELAWLRH
jgi:hypothetical protein